MSHPILEPLSTGDIIDKSIRIYRRHLRPLLAVVAAPFVFGAGAWLAMWFGLAEINPDNPNASPGAAAALIVAGLLCYLGYAYAMFLVLGGLSRAIGDHIMLGDAITARAVIRAIHGRLGALTGASFLLALLSLALFAIFGVALFLSLMVIGFVVMAATALHLPEPVGTGLALLVLLAVMGVLLFVVMPILLARVVFVPQVVMIEGASATQAVGRAMSLGSRNWTRVLAIWLFSICTSYSLAVAVMAPIALLLWLVGYLTFDLETLEGINNGVNQFSSFLVVPVWAIAFTLLYFDNRVRKEGYDVDLLVRRLPPIPARTAPAFAPTPVRPAFAVQTPAAVPAHGRCPRCGRYNLFNSPTCVGCGWSMR